MSTVTIIEPKTKKENEQKNAKKLRVAAYARVSTDKDEQFSSFEAQIDYYTKYICSNGDWEFVRVYSDGGITGTSTKNRRGFNQMINDAKKGEIDLIITKSVSRFARNTVDSLMAIRELKACKTEVFFEKENIRTFDGKGELLITIMSSLAQEESRSISENITWGIRKRFADGKYVMNYHELLGYEKGPDGPVINEEEAKTVRRIFYMCLQGLDPNRIAKILNRDGVKTPTGKEKWYPSVVKSILGNEKYTGDALLQKTFSTGFPEKKRKKNEGELPQYYVRSGHPAIIDAETFEAAGAVISGGSYLPAEKPFERKLICGACGNTYYKTVWHPGRKGEAVMWRCVGRMKNTCKAPYLSKNDIDRLHTEAIRGALSDPWLCIGALSALIMSGQRLNAAYTEAALLGKSEAEQRRKNEIAQSLERSDNLKKLVDEYKSKNDKASFSASLVKENVVEILIKTVSVKNTACAVTLI